MAVKSPNPLKQDPTRTQTLRRIAQADVKRRFARLQRAVLARVHEMFGDGTGWQMMPVTDRARIFEAWVDQESASVLETANPAWLQKHMESAHRKGMERAYQDVKGSLPVIDDAYQRGRRDEFIERVARTRRSTVHPLYSEPLNVTNEAGDTLTLLSERLTSLVQGATDDMSRRMAQAILDASQKGSSAADLAKKIADIMGVSQERALLIARTELIRSHAEAQLDAFEALGVDELGVMVEWVTGGGLRTCDRCASMAGKVFKIEKARGMIPLHPRCRCSFVPKLPDPEPPAKRSVRR